MDLIERQAAIDAVCESCNLVGDYHKCDGYPNDSTWCEEVTALRNVPSAQPERIQNNAVHLCDSCQYTYVTCPSHGNDAVFGGGKGNDNICACNKYKPSAQPGTHARDLIERQAAIDEIESTDWYHINTGGELVHGANSKEDKPLYKAKDIYSVIENLPSAQPAIIHCRDCKHYYYADNRIPQEQTYTCDLEGDRWQPDSFCSFAERREE